MNTSERTAGMLKEQLAFAAREVGDAWDEAALAIERFKLGFISLITTGDADKVLSEFDKTVKSIKDSVMNAILDEGDAGTTPFEGFMKQFEVDFEESTTRYQKSRI